MKRQIRLFLALPAPLALEACGIRIAPAGTADTSLEYWICVNKADKTARICLPISRGNSIRKAGEGAG